ncbi:MAG: 30S ribosomal protein S11 [bacterium]|nr:30S ribosomal protein S11 [bacterium]
MAEVKKKKKKKKLSVSTGRVYVFSSYNNTIITFTDEGGNTLAQGSSGQYGFKGPKKATPYAAGVVVRETAEKIGDIGLKNVSVFINGIGSGRDGALRAINAMGYSISKIRDITPIPHNGCRPKKPRRV